MLSKTRHAPVGAETTRAPVLDVLMGMVNVSPKDATAQTMIVAENDNRVLCNQLYTVSKFKSNIKSETGEILDYACWN